MTDIIDLSTQLAQAKVDIEQILAGLASKIDTATPAAPLSAENTAATIEAAVKASIEKHVHSITAGIASGEAKAVGAFGKIRAFLAAPTPLWLTLALVVAAVACVVLR